MTSARPFCAVEGIKPWLERIQEKLGGRCQDDLHEALSEQQRRVAARAGA